jgi:hypothetical protein
MADEDKLINVIVRYSTQGAKEAADSYTLTGKAADTFYKQQHATWDKLGKDFEDFQNGYKASGEKIKKTTKEFGDEVKKTETNFRELKSISRDLGQIGTTLAIGGGLLTGGIVAEANNYVQTMGSINKYSAEWLGYQNQIKNSNLEIGQVATQALLPAMKAAAELMQKVAEIARENPWLVQGALTVGGIMTALGLATKTIADLSKVVSEVGLLAGKFGIGKSINKYGGVGNAEYLPGGPGPGQSALGKAGQAVGAVTLIASSVIIGAELGNMLGNAIAKLFDKDAKDQSMGETLLGGARIFETIDLLILKGLRDLGLISDDTTKKIHDLIRSIDNWEQEILGVKAAQDQAKAQQEQITQSEVQAYIGYQKQMAQAEKQYDQQRVDIVKQTEKEMADATAQYQEQRRDIISNGEEQYSRIYRDYLDQQEQGERTFRDQQEKEQKSYQDQVSKSNRDFAKQQKEESQKHAQEMKQLDAEHNAKMNDLAAARDALGLVKEQESYQREKNQKNEEYTTQRRQEQQQHAQQLADQKVAFEQQRADQIAAYEKQREEQRAAFARSAADQASQEQEQLTKLDASHKQQMDKLQQGEKEKLSKLQQAYNDQVNQIQSAFVDRLRSLDSAILGDTKKFNEYMQNQAAEFQKWLDNYKSTHSDSTTVTKTGTTGGATATYAPHYETGYAPFGQYTLGDRPGGGKGDDEFVMGGNLTKFAESIVGGRITQQNLAAMMIGARNGGSQGSGRNLTVNVQSRSLSMSEIRREIDGALDMKLGRLLAF